MRRNRRAWLRTVGLVAVGGIAGCSGDDTSSIPGGDETDAASTATRTDEFPERETDSETATERVPESAKLAPDSLGEADTFGHRVAISGDGTTALVGALGEKDEYRDPGQAFVFQAEGGEWVQRARFTADDEDVGSQFGFSVALSADGTTGLIGCPTGGTGDQAPPGNVYVVTENDGEWETATKLTAGEQRPAERFGIAVSLSGDAETALVGANQFSQEHQYHEGWIHVLTNEDGSWEHRARVTADEREDGDRFALELDLSSDGSTALVGASQHSNENGESAGAAFVFAPEDGTWAQRATLLPDDAQEYAQVGAAVALSADGTDAFLGDSQHVRSDDQQTGAMYTFDGSGTSWERQETVIPDGIADHDDFGTSVAVAADGTLALVGSSAGQGSGGGSAGSVHLLEQRDGSWHQRDQYTEVAGRGQSDDGFGSSVALSADGTIGLVGALKDSEAGFYAGAAYALGL